jgi:hypothetical protein
MTGQSRDRLEHPESVRGPDGERRDGRPAIDKDEGIGTDIPQEEAETVAPEEQGGAPTTEHAPGADL